MLDWSQYYASRASRMQASEIRELLKLLDQPGIISFAGGIPDPALFPREEIAAICARVLSDPVRSAAALQYAVSEGYLPLREWITNYMGTLGLPCTAENILITNGSQQGLDFLGKLFIGAGDTVLVGWPTYLGALQAFNAYEPKYDQLPGPGSNRTPQSYTAGGKAKPKFGYAIPEFQNPTGTSMPAAERLALLDAMETLEIPLIEDSAYEHLRYEGERAPPIIATAAQRAGGIDNARVVYCGTFSKSIVPALRIGWIVAPKELIRKLVLINQASDLHVSTLNQIIAHELAVAIWDSHTAKLRAAYKVRRDAMLEALETHMPKGVGWTRPEGGMMIWVTVPEKIDGADLLRRAIDEVKVAFVPGNAFYPDRSVHNTIRLSFSLNEPAVIDEGVRRLGDLLRGLI